MHEPFSEDPGITKLWTSGLERTRDTSDDDERALWADNLERWRRYVKRFEGDPRDIP